MPELRGTVADSSSASFFLNLRAGRQYIVDVAPDPVATDPLIDPVLAVRDSLGALVVGTSPNPSDDEGPGASPQFFFTPAATGMFEFSVRGFGGEPGGFVASIFADDFRNHPTGVAPAGVLETELDGRIDYRGDLDIFEATLVQGLEYRIDVRGAGAGSRVLDDPVVRLFDGSTLLGEDDNGGAGFDASLRHVATFSGIHSIEASGFGGARGGYRVTLEGFGTEASDVITGTSASDWLNALGGEDRLSGGGGDDRLKGGADGDRVAGGAGRDILFGNRGDDRLRGDGGDDRLVGALGVDELIGGRGDDRFEFAGVGESPTDAPDVIRAGAGAVAFEGAGIVGGDRIDLRGIDANVLRAGDQAFAFGERGIGSVWTRDVGDVTRVYANVDANRRAELRIDIEDGAVLAEDYAARDFLL